MRSVSYTVHGVAQPGRGAAPKTLDITMHKRNDSFAFILGAALAAFVSHHALAGTPSELAWSTYFGSPYLTESWDTAVDQDGNVIVTGGTEGGLPVTAGAYDTTYGGNLDCYVAKFNGTDGSLLWCTYIGGSLRDEGNSILPLDNGDIVICGNTQGGFTVPDGPYDTHNGGYYDVFVVRLSGDGTALEGGMFIGGSDTDETWERTRIAADAEGNICLTGETYSDDFPATPGANDEELGGLRDAFVAKVSGDFQAIVYATYLGGSSIDVGKGLVIDDEGNAYVCGMTQSDDFPATPGAYDDEYAGEWDAFVAKVKSDGSDVDWATFLGGVLRDYAWDIAREESGKLVIAGKTHNADFPVTPGAYDETFNGPFDTADIMVARLSGNGKKLIAATFLGGKKGDISLGLARDAAGNIWLSGETASHDFPLKNAFQIDPRNKTTNCYVAALSKNLARLVFSGYLGGKGNDLEGHIAVGSDGNPVVSGNTDSTKFPVTAGAYQGELLGFRASFITKVEIGPHK